MSHHVKSEGIRRNAIIQFNSVKISRGRARVKPPSCQDYTGVAPTVLPSHAGKLSCEFAYSTLITLLGKQ